MTRCMYTHPHDVPGLYLRAAALGVGGRGCAGGEGNKTAPAPGSRYGHRQSQAGSTEVQPALVRDCR